MSYWKLIDSSHFIFSQCALFFFLSLLSVTLCFTDIWPIKQDEFNFALHKYFYTENSSLVSSSFSSMAPVLSSLRQKKPLSGVIIISLLYAIYRSRSQFKNNASKKPTSSNQKKHKKVGVNAEFLEQMKKLFPICVPGKKRRGKYFKEGWQTISVGLFSKESCLLVVLASVLIARTWLDIWFSGFNGYTLAVD